MEKKDWILRGKVTLEGVTFFINDCTKKEAIKRANRGDFDDRDDNVGAASD